MWDIGIITVCKTHQLQFWVDWLSFYPLFGLPYYQVEQTHQNSKFNFWWFW